MHRRTSSRVHTLRRRRSSSALPRTSWRIDPLTSTNARAAVTDGTPSRVVRSASNSFARPVPADPVERHPALQVGHDLDVLGLQDLADSPEVGARAMGAVGTLAADSSTAWTACSHEGGAPATA